MPEACRRILEQLDLGVIVTGATFERILFANAAANSILGLSSADDRIPPSVVKACRQRSLRADGFATAFRASVAATRDTVVRAKLLPGTPPNVLITLTSAVVRRGDLRDLLRRKSALSHREIDVAVLLRTGLSNAEIGGRLGIGVSTVKTYVANILSTFQIHRRAGLVDAIERLDRDDD